MPRKFKAAKTCGGWRRNIWARSQLSNTTDKTTEPTVKAAHTIATMRTNSVRLFVFVFSARHSIAPSSAKRRVFGLLCGFPLYFSTLSVRAPPACAFAIAPALCYTEYTYHKNERERLV